MSQCIPPVEQADLPPESAEFLKALEERFPEASELLSAAAHSPLALHALAYQSASESMGRLPPRARQAIALRAAELLSCPFNVARYTTAARQAGLPEETLEAFRRGVSCTPREQALLALTTKLVKGHGRHTRLVFDVARELGISHAEILELITIVASVTFTSYLAGVACIEPQVQQPVEQDPAVASALAAAAE